MRPRESYGGDQEDIMVHLGQHLMKQYHKSHLVIRFALGGCANRPYYRIVVAENKRARDGKYVEQLGCYDPLPNDHGEKIIGLNIERIKYWLGRGAYTSMPFQKLLGLAGFFPLHPMTITNAERLKRKRARETAAVMEAASVTQEEDSAAKE
ncbi:PREDICTED: 28S ribosomal protein S16, mitochondrial isoform X1 [Gekko japonicus]|uniref:Small ribosomal subunit protein bS16m n=2 Tax=Gekko japonicus TaxID=146911 RepID=A0ABM1KKB6_GEKJA|nr:PREDICTED: 28S ribosomal protein S16, mitochondrial isoform X1 [Gekko japonicus]